MDLQPFRVHISELALDDLRQRLRHTRWPAPSPTPGWTRGVPLGDLQRLTTHWHDTFDWRAQEHALNHFPQFTTVIHGQTIHCLHAPSPEPSATPLILTHGWPSAPLEFHDLIHPLTHPRQHGARAEDAFHVIVPSLPGYGFSTPAPTEGAGNLYQVALLWLELMTRLNYQRFAAYGTDVGAGVTDLLAMIAPERVTGTYVTGTVAAMPFGPPLDPTALPEAERPRAERFNAFQADGLGYLHQQATRPQTLAYSLHDSPTGQLAWMLEKFHDWSDPTSPFPRHERDLTTLLTLASVYWFTGSGASTAHRLYDGMRAYRQMTQHPTTPAASPVPRAVGVFAADTTVRSVFDPHRQVRHWAEFDRGGHFPALEVPYLLLQDLRAFFSRVNRPERAAH